MPLTPFNTFTQQELIPCFWPEDLRVKGYAMAANQSLLQGTVVAVVTNAAVNDVQSIATSGSPTGGTITLIFNGQQTSPLPYNATAAQIQTALQALSNVGPGGLLATGGALGTAAVVITAASSLANQPQATIQVVSALTGGTSPAVTVTHNGTGGTSIGVASGAIVPYNSANSDGSQNPIGFLMTDSTTDASGKLTAGRYVGGQHNLNEYGARVAVTGTYRVSDLIGLDANAISKLGRLIDGSLSANGVLKVY